MTSTVSDDRVKDAIETLERAYYRLVEDAALRVKLAVFEASKKSGSLGIGVGIVPMTIIEKIAGDVTQGVWTQGNVSRLVAMIRVGSAAYDQNTSTVYAVGERESVAFYNDVLNKVKEPLE